MYDPAATDNAIFRIGLLGHGTVGASSTTSWAPAAPDRRDHGFKPVISGVLTRSRSDVDGIATPTSSSGDGRRSDYDYVVRAIPPANVVTANKQLLGVHGRSCGLAASTPSAALRGGRVDVPVIRVLQESLVGDHIDRVHGIVNGTTNFILSQMAATGAPYADALAEAQRLGYAEADPTEDVNGKDAAAKMAILARLAFNTPVSLEDVRYEGTST